MSSEDTTKNKMQWPVFILLGIVFGAAVFISLNGDDFFKSEKTAEPLAELGPGQKQKFYEASKVFTHRFTAEEGLGPRFNGRSCYQCHGEPGPVGSEGQEPITTSLLRVASRLPESPKFGKKLGPMIALLDSKDVQNFENNGGPVVFRHSITDEALKQFPSDCKVDLLPIPSECEFKSLRHSPQILGIGLVSAIDDDDLIELEDVEVDQDVDMAGRAVEMKDPLTAQARVGRFGLKNQDATVLSVVAEMMNQGLGLTTPLEPSLGTVGGINDLPRCVVPVLPPEPNDLGRIQASLTYFLSLTAPPPRGEITSAVQSGEKIFTKLQCAFCHTPELRTKDYVQVVDPASPFPELRYIEVKALENKPVKAYSDFLLHNMGSAACDGLPQAKALSGEWRTAPLWGLRFRKYFMHDGSKTDLESAILAHAGQAKSSRDAYKELSTKEKQELHAFLKSL